MQTEVKVTKPNVLFVTIPGLPLEKIEQTIEGTPAFFHVVMPMGILYLSSYAKAKGLVNKSGVVDYLIALQAFDEKNVTDFINNKAKDIDFTPDVIAFSANFTSAHNFLVLAVRQLKEMWPNATTVVGGHHGTSCYGRLLEEPSLDLVVRGEGEIGFADMLAGFGSKDPAEVKGVYTKEKFDRIGATEICELVNDLDEIPSPDWELIDMDAYLTSFNAETRKVGSKGRTGNAARRIATFSTSRGCPFSCTFCASHHVHGRTMRYRSAEVVLEDFRQLHERYGANVFFPDDDLFTANKKKIVPILEGFRDRFPDCELQTPGGLSVNTLDDEILDLFIQTGSSVLTLAVESGNDYVQRHVIKKRCNLEKAKHQVKYLRDRDVIVRVFFIIGFPEETYEQMKETIDFGIDLSADWSGVAIAIPLPGSEMYDEFIDSGDISENLIWDGNFMDERPFDTPLVSSEVLRELQFDGNLKLNFFGNPNLREGKYERALELFEDLVEQHTFQIAGWYCVMLCQLELGRPEAALKTQELLKAKVHSDFRAQKIYRKVADKLSKLDHSGLEIYLEAAA